MGRTPHWLKPDSERGEGLLEGAEGGASSLAVALGALVQKR
jgi:hypothetical protein